MADAQKKFLEILKSLKETGEQEKFFNWARNYIDHYELETNEETNKEIGQDKKAELLLSCIKASLKQMVPFEAVLKSEKVMFPTIGDDSNLHEKNCTHVDAFLYDEDEVDKLVDEDKLSTHICLNCESTDVEPITFITHSASKERLKFIFQKALPSLENQIVLDIGSRLGVVLYAGYSYSKAKELIGIELNKDWCKIQNDIVSRFKLNDRIKIVEGNIMKHSEIIRKSSVVILHNVFEWFMSPTEQEQIWNFLYSAIEPGSIIVAAPPIEISLALLNTEIIVDNWVQERTIEVDCCTEETELKVYNVIKK